MHVFFSPLSDASGLLFPPCLCQPLSSHSTASKCSEYDVPNLSKSQIKHHHVGHRRAVFISRACPSRTDHLQDELPFLYSKTLRRIRKPGILLGKTLCKVYVYDTTAKSLTQDTVTPNQLKKRKKRNKQNHNVLAQSLKSPTNCSLLPLPQHLSLLSKFLSTVSQSSFTFVLYGYKHLTLIHALIRCFYSCPPCALQRLLQVRNQQPEAEDTNPHSRCDFHSRH